MDCDAGQRPISRVLVHPADRDEVRRALARLPSAEKGAFLLYYLEGFDVNEIAFSLSCDGEEAALLLLQASRCFRQALLENADS